MNLMKFSEYALAVHAEKMTAIIKQHLNILSWLPDDTHLQVYCYGGKPDVEFKDCYYEVSLILAGKLFQNNQGELVTAAVELVVSSAKADNVLELLKKNLQYAEALRHVKFEKEVLEKQHQTDASFYMRACIDDRVSDGAQFTFRAEFVSDPKNRRTNISVRENVLDQLKKYIREA